jgi:uncharacterized membrane protein YkoI
MKSLRILSALALSLTVAAALYAVPPKGGPVSVKKPLTASKRAHKYTAKQAQAIALKKYPGKVVGKVALANQGGKYEYVVYVQTKKQLMCVDVNADTGKIDSATKGTVKKPGKGKAAG